VAINDTHFKLITQTNAVVKKSDRKTYVWGSAHKALGNLLCQHLAD